ncbi:50S ribosomal protein L7/L12 [Enterobacteriaceae endosymbiont of Macroplea appendiculata]|uniref:50S ribosomal protein L7/L12 n=1 Tax=Enterobacteriaceae endosymbiont of Macroplea appendiculata TaxID=2675790 RepID=UPI00144A1A9C|nr:50S ribosomal protein L7/L12 [Enterobacteriaceae endosymbiont of Macroplea appendiculata]QJC30922.1 50S ribosomal protein L7/L12 [Enterobacteriaceae endosymbiont of Macroplea appendiculata]
MSITKEQIIQEIESMSVMDVMELVKLMEKKFDVSTANYFNNTNNSTKEKIVEEKTEFSIYLTNIGKNKISVIKAVRSIMNLGLKEAKDLVESAPVVLKEAISKTEVTELEKILKNAGAEIEIK